VPVVPEAERGGQAPSDAVVFEMDGGGEGADEGVTLEGGVGGAGEGQEGGYLGQEESAVALAVEDDLKAM
jgi:hypothetical protein